MSSREFSEWMAFYVLEPWGWQMENWRSALGASVIANVYRNTKKHKKPFEIEDFMPVEHEVSKRERGVAVDQDILSAKLNMAMMAFGGRMPGMQGAA